MRRLLIVLLSFVLYGVGGVVCTSVLPFGEVSQHNPPLNTVEAALLSLIAALLSTLLVSQLKTQNCGICAAFFVGAAVPIISYALVVCWSPILSVSRDTTFWGKILGSFFVPLFTAIFVFSNFASLKGLCVVVGSGIVMSVLVFLGRPKNSS